MQRCARAKVGDDQMRLKPGIESHGQNRWFPVENSMIKMCWGIHNNGCTEAAMHGSIFCEPCAAEYWDACDIAETASREPQNRHERVLGKNRYKECKSHERG